MKNKKHYEWKCHWTKQAKYLQRDWFTVQSPLVIRATQAFTKLPYFTNNPHWFLIGFCFSHSQPIGNPGIISPDLLLAVFQKLLGVIQFSETQDFSQDMEGLKRNILLNGQWRTIGGDFWSTSVFLYSWILNEDRLDVDTKFYNDNTVKCMQMPSIYPKHELLRKKQIPYYNDLNCSVCSFVLWKEKQIGVNN